MRYVILYPENQHMEASSDSVLELYSDLEEKHGVGKVVAIHIAENEDPFNPDNYAYYDSLSLKAALQQEKEIEEIIKIAENAGWTACIAPFGNLTLSICKPEFNDGADEVHVCVDDPYRPTNESMLRRVLRSLYESDRNTRAYQAMRRKNNPLAWDDNVMIDNQLLLAIQALIEIFEEIEEQRVHPKKPSYIDDIMSVCKELERRGYDPLYDESTNAFAVYIPIDEAEDDLILYITYPNPIIGKESFVKVVLDNANWSISTKRKELRTFEIVAKAQNQTPEECSLTKVSASELNRRIRWLTEITQVVDALKRDDD